MNKAAATKAFWLCMAVFFVQPLHFGIWLSRVAEVQSNLELSTSELALAFLGMPIGLLPTLYFAGRIVDRLGSRSALLWSFPAILAVGVLPALATGQAFLFMALFVLGAAMAFTQVALNVFAATTEKALGKAIMNRAHGFWSLGLMVGSFMGVQLAGFDIAALRSLLVGGLCLLPLLWMIAYALPVQKLRQETAQHSHQLPEIPRGIYLIVMIVFGATIVEGAMVDWAAVYMRDVVEIAAGKEGLAVTVFAGFVTAGRFIGDVANRRYGPVVLARACIASALCGLVLLISDLGVILSYAGFALAGLGVSTIFPLGVSASASLSETGQARNVSVMTFGALTGFLIGPPVIGFMAEATSLNVAFALLIPSLVVSFIFAQRLSIPRQ